MYVWKQPDTVGRWYIQEDIDPMKPFKLCGWRMPFMGWVTAHDISHLSNFYHDIILFPMAAGTPVTATVHELKEKKSANWGSVLEKYVFIIYFYYIFIFHNHINYKSKMNLKLCFKMFFLLIKKQKIIFLNQLYRL